MIKSNPSAEKSQASPKKSNMTPDELVRHFIKNVDTLMEAGCFFGAAYCGWEGYFIAAAVLVVCAICSKLDGLRK